jgi:hypothetical protein
MTRCPRLLPRRGALLDLCDDRGRHLISVVTRHDGLVWNTIRLVDRQARLFDLVAWLQAQPCESETHEVTVWVQSGKHQTPMKIRLIARRKPPEVIAAEHKRLRQQASRKQHALDPRSLIAAEYLILATSLPEGEFPAT